jgi:hypothetical protein
VSYREVFTHHSPIALYYVLDKAKDRMGEVTIALCNEWRSISRRQFEWKCIVSGALFRLAAQKQRVDLDILQMILQEFPYPAQFGLTESLVQAIVDAFRDMPDVVEPVELTLLKRFADFFLMETAQIQAHHLPQDLQGEMRMLMRRVFRKNKAYDREMMQYYLGSKAKITKFAMLVR